jgi:phosphoglycerate dehydrogenase-like enzyme
MDSGQRRLDRFLIRFDAPPTLIQRVRERFPAIEFIVVPDTASDQLIAECDAVLAWHITEAELELAQRLKWVQWIGAGVENAPLLALRRRNILLTNNRGVHAINIAEHVVAMMLAFARALPYLLNAQAQGIWADDAGRKLVREISGSTLLVLGSGNIGLALAERGRALGQKVTIVGRTAQQLSKPRTRIHSIDSLPDLLPGADHVAICLPLTPETHRLIDQDSIRMMKPGAFLYNIGRGSIVDTEALTVALQDGLLGGAGLDVTDPEPLPPGHPLWTMPNVMLTAHTAGATPNYWNRGEEILIENIERYLDGRELRNLVNLELGY